MEYLAVFAAGFVVALVFDFIYAKRVIAFLQDERTVVLNTIANTESRIKGYIDSKLK